MLCRSCFYANNFKQDDANFIDQFINFSILNSIEKIIKDRERERETYILIYLK